MHALRILVIVAAIGGASGARAQQDATLDLLLSRWAMATRDCTSIDVRFVRFTYDRTFGELNEHGLWSTKVGRFYREAVGYARYEVGADEVVIWHPDARFCFHPALRLYDRVPINPELNRKYRDGKRQLLADRDAWFRDFRLALVRLLLAQPDDVLPFLLLEDVAGFRQRFRLSLDGIDEELLLTAEAQDPDAEGFEKEQFLFARPESTELHLPSAIRVIYARGASVTYSFEDMQINRAPANREELLFPDPRLVRELSR